MSLKPHSLNGDEGAIPNDERDPLGSHGTPPALGHSQRSLSVTLALRALLGPSLPSAECGSASV